MKNLVLVGIFIVIACGSSSWAQDKQGQDPEKEFRSTVDRIEYALAKKEISLKEAVILEARLIFAPDSIPKDSKYAPLPGEKLIDEECGTGFYKQLQSVLPELTAEEKEFLKSLSPDLKAIIEAKEADFVSS